MDDEDDFTDLGFDREELENPTYNQPRQIDVELRDNNIISPDGFGMANVPFRRTLEEGRVATLRDMADIHGNIYRLQARQIGLQGDINELETRLRIGREQLNTQGAGASPFFTQLQRDYAVLERELNTRRQELQQVLNEINNLFASRLDLEGNYTNMDTPFRNPYSALRYMRR
jgi:uncharacterized membrane-anchored protein YhcB (DUF1043 family)